MTPAPEYIQARTVLLDALDPPATPRHDPEGHRRYVHSGDGDPVAR